MMRCLEWKGQGKGPHQLSRAQPALWVIAKGWSFMVWAGLVSLGCKEGALPGPGRGKERMLSSPRPTVPSVGTIESPAGGSHTPHGHKSLSHRGDAARLQHGWGLFGA